MTYTVDATALAELAGDLVAGVDQVDTEAEQIVERGALNVRRDARRRIREQITGTYLPHYPQAITYDTESDTGGVEALIGPEVDRLQGGMGAGVEYGSARTGPLPHLLPAFEEELPRTLRHLADAAGRVLR